ncbi:MAG: hypothetical protein JRD93_16595 [Deltaproteobacteria bacterium]|nr:hypothetical protein [Deltaproteobacteria bacterium]
MAQRKIKTYRDLQVRQKSMTSGKPTMRLCASATLCLNSIKFVYDNNKKNISDDQRRSVAEVTLFQILQTEEIMTISRELLDILK